MRCLRWFYKAKDNLKWNNICLDLNKSNLVKSKTSTLLQQEALALSISHVMKKFETVEVR